jgi:hypothetical protein
MFATSETWKRFSFTTRVVQSLPRESAAETRPDAQDLDNSSESAQQGKAVTGTAGLRIQNWPLFFVLWQIIGCISAYDAFLVMQHREELRDLEQNWLGRLLLFTNAGDPALFVGVKFLGTTMVLGILANLYHSRPQRGLVIAKGVAAFQIALLAYLTCG